MSHGFAGHNGIGFSLLPLMEPLHKGIIPPRKVRRLHKRPGQILIAIFRVALAFAFPIAHLGAPHTPAVGRILADRGKAPNIPGLQHDGQRQNVADATDRE
jgi:hypothetical protein